MFFDIHIGKSVACGQNQRCTGTPLKRRPELATLGLTNHEQVEQY
jgi:hypothetical protein